MAARVDVEVLLPRASLLLLPLLLVASLATDVSGAAADGGLWYNSNGSFVAGNLSFLHVHNLSDVAPGPPGSLAALVSSSFQLPWPGTSPTVEMPDGGGGGGVAGSDSKGDGSPSTGSTAPSKSPSPAQRNPDSILGYDIPCGVRNVEETDRIVGGVDADRGEFPWQVSLQKKSGWLTRHICGGAILSPFWVVTAGHCVEGLAASELSVVAGDYDLFKIEGSEQRRQVVRVVSLGYDKDTFANDITLLQLERRLKLDAKFVAPICVPKPEHHYRDGNAVVSGWGRLSEMGGLPQRLQQVTLPLIPWETCKKRYRSKGFSKFLHTCQICSGRDQGGQDSCQGDSGGPLACREEDGRYYLCGVVSWGIGCARAEFPGVYTEVACYARWINQVLYNEHHLLDPEKEKEEEKIEE